MGFPESFEIPVSDTQAYKQFGNAVVVPVIAFLAAAMVAQGILPVPGADERSPLFDTGGDLAVIAETSEDWVAVDARPRSEWSRRNSLARS
jgi:hypothetical protein